ncbi:MULTISPECIES: TetR/AcrR family transcriptional regulator [Paenibacillus]|uniref:TetR/AcrR family transcriptional regulator n=1 Tax=Paenibacillus TaxID=44249 RepID=UPI0022B88E5A|nr:TetR/AcrR family transcriptional regulator [Paenibacillus caseinilyticus]MCZ8521662.1 TetR/AcrR family transcriptional regulator [Paenibacillus caseinilyticus]
MDNEFEESLPRGVALSWGLVKPTQRGPKREMSLKQIVDSAIAIADNDGLSAVSMHKVAASLGFTTMALYRYVPGKEDLILLMQDAVFDISIPEETSAHWREQMTLFVMAIMRCYQDHPWLCDIPASGIPITPNNLRFVDWAMRIMQHLPLDHHEKISIMVLLTSHARIYSFFQRDMDRAVQTGVNSGPVPGVSYTAALEHLVTPERFPYLRPVILAGAYSPDDKEVKDEHSYGFEFDFALARILDGMEHYMSSKKMQEPDLS